MRSRGHMAAVLASMTVLATIDAIHPNLLADNTYPDKPKQPKHGEFNEDKVNSAAEKRARKAAKRLKTMVQS